MHIHIKIVYFIFLCFHKSSAEIYCSVKIILMNKLRTMKLRNYALTLENCFFYTVLNPSHRGTTRQEVMRILNTCISYSYFILKVYAGRAYCRKPDLKPDLWIKNGRCSNFVLESEIKTLKCYEFSTLRPGFNKLTQQNDAFLAL